MNILKHIDRPNGPLDMILLFLQMLAKLCLGVSGLRRVRGMKFDLQQSKQLVIPHLSTVIPHLMRDLALWGNGAGFDGEVPHQVRDDRGGMRDDRGGVRDNNNNGFGLVMESFARGCGAFLFGVWFGRAVRFSERSPP